jgi:hypothetical protein
MIIFILLTLAISYLLFKSKYEHFNNFEIWNNNLTQYDNLDNLSSINGKINYKQIPMYNSKDYNATVWHLRFPNMVTHRYSYNDIKTTKNDDIKCESWDYGNNNNNCHANNCTESNCYGDNCYEQNYALLKDLPTCQDNKNCPIDELF